MRDFLRLYHGSDVETARMEQVLGVARAFLATAGLAAIFLDPTEPVRFASAVYALLSVYAVYSLAVLAGVRRRPPTSPRWSLALHAVDIGFASALTSLSAGPSSPFFLFFIYALLAAAYRWRLSETIGTALVAIVIYMVQVGVLTHHVDPIFVVTRLAYLLVAGGLLGYLADQEKQIRAELRALNAATRIPGRRVGPRMAGFARLMARLFDARAAALILDQPRRRRAWLWMVDPAGAGPRVRRRALTPAERHAWLFPAPDTWCVTTGADGQQAAFVPQPGAWTLTSTALTVPANLPAGGRFRALMGAALPLGSAGHLRLLLFDPATNRLRARLNFLSRLARHAAPALANVLLAHRLRARATADERARVARELHDGAIQSLVGIELRTAALQRQSGMAPAVAEELQAIQGLLRNEVVALRTLMLELRPPDLEEAAQLPAAITAVAERFRRDTGIAVHVACQGDTSRLPQRTAIELVRIVQEALVNVRKHSGASRVEVRLADADAGWRLTIEDDGCGMAPRDDGGASPRWRWPAIIRERTRAIGGALAVASPAGHGLKLDITVPEARDA